MTYTVGYRIGTIPQKVVRIEPVDADSRRQAKAEYARRHGIPSTTYLKVLANNQN